MKIPGTMVQSTDYGALKVMGVRVVGVSRDSVESHDKFVPQHELPFELVSDDGTLCEGVLVWKL